MSLTNSGIGKGSPQVNDPGIPEETEKLQHSHLENQIQVSNPFLFYLTGNQPEDLSII
jgi:hypothetical protein